MRIAVAGDGDALPGDLLALLAAAGLPTAGLAALPAAAAPRFATGDEVEWLVAGSADVLAVCACGAAEAGIVGKDVLLEHESSLCELVDLGVGKGRLVYAVPNAPRRPARRRPRVATRYPAVMRRWFGAQGRNVEALLMTAPALAVRLGIADGVVDLEGRLPDGDDWTVVAEIAACSARLVTGRQARALHSGELAGLIDRLRKAQETR